MPSPTVAIKEYARWVLRSKEQPDLVRAVCENIDAAYYGGGIVNPDYHRSRAERVIGKLGLEEGEVARASQIAQELYQQYQNGARIERSHPNPKKRILMQKFQRLIKYSDVELRILNSNVRGNYRDKVYNNADAETKSRIARRTLTSEEWWDLEREIERKEDEIFLNVSNIYEPWRLNVYALGKLYNSPRPLEYKDKWELFTKYVLDLLRGEVLSKSELQSNDIDPVDVKKLADLIQKHYIVQESERLTELRQQRRRRWHQESS